MSRTRTMATRGPIRSLSIWRPVGPPGCEGAYSILGDVAVSGPDPPIEPAQMYLVAHGRDAPSEGPRLAPPTGRSFNALKFETAPLR